MLTINLFGHPEIRLNQQPVELPRRKARLLAFYLAASAGPVARVRLRALFWPDLEREAAQQSLRTTLHSLRQVLGSALESTPSEVFIDAADIDVRVFSVALAMPALPDHALAAALQRYRGAFLADQELPENPELDDWLTAERERYQRLAVRGMSQLARRYVERQDYAAALEWLAHATLIDPLHEALQREIMQVEYYAGDRAAAIRRYEQLQQRLDDQLGVPPLPETRALYDAIVTESLPAVPERQALSVAPMRTVQSRVLLETAAPELPFVGRETELALLRSMLGGSQLALIEGEPGIGKSALAEQFVRTSSCFSMVGSARELELAQAYHPLVDAMRQVLERPDWPAIAQQLDLASVWRNELARLLPELGSNQPLPAAADETRLWEAISQFLQALARIRPVILVLDDLHWADLATLGVLAYLVRRTASAPMTLVATTRPPEPRTPAATLLHTLTREGRLVRIALTRLTSADAHALATIVSQNHAAQLATWLDQTAEGNPYIMVELLRSARQHGLVQPDGELSDILSQHQLFVPQTVESLIQSRLARLSEAARLLLDTAVAAGREFAYPLVAQASALSEAAALDGLDELRHAHLVVQLPDGRYRIDHSLTMEVAYREIGEPRHRRLHRRIAETLEARAHGQTEPVATLLAWHYHEAQADDRAAPYALQAARNAVRLAAWQPAIRFYRQALASPAMQANLLLHLELGEALAHVGDIAAAQVYQEAIDLARSTGDRLIHDAARIALSEVFLQQARYAEAVELMRQVRATGHPGSAVRAELVWGIVLSVEGADLAGASQHLAQAETLNDAQADPATHATILFERGSVAAQQGDLATAIALYQRSLTSAEQAPEAWRQRVLAHNNLAYHLLLLGDPAAEAHARRALALSQESGMVAMQPFVYSTLGEIALQQGQLLQAEQLFQEGLALAERLTIPERIAGLTANLGLVAIQRGETTRAVHRLTTAQAHADALGIPQLATQIRIWLAPLLPLEEARATLAAARAIAEAGGRQRLLNEIARAEASV